MRPLFIGKSPESLIAGIRSMISLKSIHRVQRGSEREGSDIEALAGGTSGINVDEMRGGESFGEVQPATTTKTRVTWGLPSGHTAHGLPAGQISVQNGILFEEERLRDP